MPAQTDLAECPFKIGNTPLARVELTLNGHRHELFLKEERLNEFGSIKDRVAWYILAKAIEDNGPVRSVVDASSGNYGYALACICERMGIGAVIVSSPTISRFNADGIKRAGATLVIADAAPGECGNSARIRVAREIAEREGHTFLNQYENFRNPASHELWTAPEVFAEGPFDACFTTSSSGGTARGFTDYLCKKKLPTELFLVEPAASCAFLEPGEAGANAKLKVPGYGSQRRSAFADVTPDPAMLRVDEASVLAAFTLFEEHGIAYSGLSSAGVILGALRWLAQQDAPKRAVCICADGDERYLEEITERYVPSVGTEAYQVARGELAPIVEAMARD